MLLSRTHWVLAIVAAAALTALSMCAAFVLRGYVSEYAEFDPATFPQRAEAAIRRGELTAAARLCRMAAGIDRGDSRAYLLLAYIQMVEGGAESAVADSLDRARSSAETRIVEGHEPAELLDLVHAYTHMYGRRWRDALKGFRALHTTPYARSDMFRTAEASAAAHLGWLDPLAALPAEGAPSPLPLPLAPELDERTVDVVTALVRTVGRAPECRPEPPAGPDEGMDVLPITPQSSVQRSVPAELWVDWNRLRHSLYLPVTAVGIASGPTGEPIRCSFVAENLVPEPHMEWGCRGTDLPLGWQIVPADQSQEMREYYRAVEDPEPDHDGDMCIQIAEASRLDGTALAADDLAVSPAGIYLLSVARRGSPDATAATDWLAPDGQTVRTDHIPALQGPIDIEWTRHTVAVQAPINASSCRIRLANYDNDSPAWFDDILFCELPEIKLHTSPEQG